MGDALPMLPSQTNRDTEHLQLLSIFHFIGAGLALLGIVFLLVHYTIFSTFVNNPKFWAHQRQGPPPPELFAMLKWFYLLGGVWFVTSCVLNLLSGLFMRARKRRTFSLVVAAINCLHMPLGTVLGIFTIVVLSRDSVRRLYEHG